MKRFFKWLLYILVALVLLAAFSWFWLIQKPVPETISYGMSFNTPYAAELGLDWREVYDATLDDLGVRKLRLAAHWPMVEPMEGVYDFSALDYQIERAEEVGATVILAVGRRLPRWPECHTPDWVDALDKGQRQAAQLRYTDRVVKRYKDSSAVIMWQVENEPFLEVFAFEHCGELDVELLDREIALVREADPTRPILVTDSGNLGGWRGAYQRGDVFGTSMYVHFWTPELGQFRTVLPPAAYRFKDNLMAALYGRRPSILVELSAEPWLVEPIAKVSIETQFSRMDLNKFEDILQYAAESRFDTQYLWGVEWWFWLGEHGHPEFWQRGQQLYKTAALEVQESEATETETASTTEPELKEE